MLICILLFIQKQKQFLRQSIIDFAHDPCRRSHYPVKVFYSESLWRIVLAWVCFGKVNESKVILARFPLRFCRIQRKTEIASHHRCCHLITHPRQKESLFKSITPTFANQELGKDSINSPPLRAESILFVRNFPEPLLFDLFQQKFLRPPVRVGSPLKPYAKMIPKKVTRDKRAGSDKIHILVSLDKVKASGNRFNKSIIPGAEPKEIAPVKVRCFKHSKLLS